MAEAQFNLGICYLHGLGLPASGDSAVEWLQKAAAQDYQPAIKALSDLSAELAGG